MKVICVVLLTIGLAASSPTNTGSCSLLDYGTRIASPGTQCQHFIVCAGQKFNPDGTIDYYWVEQPCSVGTLWDDKLKTCNHAYAVDCQDDLNERTTTMAPADDNCGTTTTLLLGTDCTKFQWCSFGDCMEMQCPSNTVYDVKSKLCKPSGQATCLEHVDDPFKCQQGEICVDLDKTGEITGQGGFHGLEIRKGVTSLVSDKPCSRQAIFKLNFERAESDTCSNEGLTGRKMLKVMMFFSENNRTGWMFDIGDSISNNGWAGDSGNSDFATEIQGKGTYMNVYANTRQPESTCKAQELFGYTGGVNASVSRVTTYIGNRYLKVTNDNGLEDENCHECLWGLAGQKDKRAEIRGKNANEDIYVAMNRVVQTYSSRTGNGVCFLKMKWVNNSDE